MRTRGEGVKNPDNFADVIYGRGRPLVRIRNRIFAIFHQIWTRAGLITTPKNHELILFSNFWVKGSILVQESILVNKESILVETIMTYRFKFFVDRPSTNLPMLNLENAGAHSSDCPIRPALQRSFSSTLWAPPCSRATPSSSTASPQDRPPNTLPSARS